MWIYIKGVLRKIKPRKLSTSPPLLTKRQLKMENELVTKTYKNNMKNL
jgi:hypothetical protein